jgi:transcriptional regulator with XRE-family HTH domain
MARPAKTANASPVKKRVDLRRARGRLPSGKPNPIDVHVGGRVRLRRTLLGMSQEKLAESLGLTFQQVQKYERGANRVGASRLYDLSVVLGVPVSYFYESMPEDCASASPRKILGSSVDPVMAIDGDEMNKRETLELVRAYYKIDDEAVRRKIYDLIRALGQLDDEAALLVDTSARAAHARA